MLKTRCAKSAQHAMTGYVEVRYEAKETGTSKGNVKKAVKKIGNSRRKVERDLRS
jgi:Protein of unknown function (DUF3606)